MPRNPKPGQRFQTNKDLAFIKAKDMERYYYQQAKHRLYFFQQADSLDSADIDVDDFYGEIGPGGAQQFKAPVEMPVHVSLNPDEKELNQYGFDHPQDAIIVFSIAVLEDLSIDFHNPLFGPKIGDRLDFYIRASLESQFELREVREWDFWGNTKAPLHLVCIAEKMLEDVVKP